MYLCKFLTHSSLPEIGRSFGGKHHSTVIHSIKKVEDLRKKDGHFNNTIGSFLEAFRSDRSFPQPQHPAVVHAAGAHPKQVRTPMTPHRRRIYPHPNLLNVKR
jgi:hypothetical protein